MQSCCMNDNFVVPCGQLWEVVCRLPTEVPWHSDSCLLVTVLLVKMPYTKAEIGEDKQKNYKESIANTVGTWPLNVDIQSSF